MPLTSKEVMICKYASQIMEEYYQLPPDGAVPADYDVFRENILSIQRLVMSRSVRREYPELFDTTRYFQSTVRQSITITPIPPL